MTRKIVATDLDAFVKNKEIRKEFYGPVLPAATWVQVERLYSVRSCSKSR